MSFLKRDILRAAGFPHATLPRLVLTLHWLTITHIINRPGIGCLDLGNGQVHVNHSSTLNDNLPMSCIELAVVRARMGSYVTHYGMAYSVSLLPDMGRFSFTRGFQPTIWTHIMR